MFIPSNVYIMISNEIYMHIYIYIYIRIIYMRYYKISAQGKERNL